MKSLLFLVLAAVMAIGLYAILQASAREPVKPVVVEVDQFETLCRAKLANLLDRHEWRTKAEGERYKDYKSYMGTDCVR